MWLLAGLVVGGVAVWFLVAWLSSSEDPEYSRVMDEAVTKSKEAHMPETKQKLSEAITKGISMRPKRAQGVYFAGEDRSDVLGAAYQGLTGEDEVHNYQVESQLEEAFPILRKKVSNPETGEVTTLKKVLRQLNDKHQWKRKNIARFVKAVEGRSSLATVSSR